MITKFILIMIGDMKSWLSIFFSDPKYLDILNLTQISLPSDEDYLLLIEIVKILINYIFYKEKVVRPYKHQFKQDMIEDNAMIKILLVNDDDDIDFAKYLKLSLR